MSAIGVTEVGVSGSDVPDAAGVPAWMVGNEGAAAGCSGVMILGRSGRSVVGVGVVAGVTGAGTTTSGWVAPMGVTGTFAGP